MNSITQKLLLSALLSLALLMALPSSALAGSPCLFSKQLGGVYGAYGDSTALATNGYVDVVTASVYTTSYTVDVGVWVDDTLVNKAVDIPALVLAYFEHANCIYAEGINEATNLGIHDLSLRIFGNRIHYYKQTTPAIPGQNGLWVQQVHQDWNKAIAALGSQVPKVNLLFTASNYIDIGNPATKADGSINWIGNGGASNGVGQGHALARVDPNAYRNGNYGKSFNEDWWGVIAAHELGHAMGFGNHLDQYYDTMCCVTPYTTQPGNTESYNFSLSQGPWNAITANNASNTDTYADPYSVVPNPVTHEIWNIPQVHGFLIPNNFAYAIIWKYTGVPCGTYCTGWQPLDYNLTTTAIATADGQLYQLHSNGSIWRYTGQPCSGIYCDGWQMLDNNAQSKALATGGGQLYQLHTDGSIWRYTGTPCGSSCPGWQKLDNNPEAKAIVAAGSQLYQQHTDGSIWRYTGTACSGTSCPGWQKLDSNSQTKTIVAAGNELYQLHTTGLIWRYTGTACSGTSCPGWQKLDQNAGTTSIDAAGTELYQLHGDGSVWRYTGLACSGTACNGWQKLDQNANIKAISAGVGTLNKIHNDGSIWHYKGTPFVWEQLDNNAKSISLKAGTDLYQLHTH